MFGGIFTFINCLFYASFLHFPPHLTEIVAKWWPSIYALDILNCSVILANIVKISHEAQKTLHFAINPALRTHFQFRSSVNNQLMLTKYKGRGGCIKRTNFSGFSLIITSYRKTKLSIWKHIQFNYFFITKLSS